MTRKFGIWAICLLMAGAAKAQLRSVPQAAEDTLEARYGVTEGVEWTDNLTSFVAVFSLDNKLHKAKFSNKGKWLYTEQSLPSDEVPQEVLDGLSKSRYADRAAAAWWIMDLAGEQEPQYRVLVVKNEVEKKYLYFTPLGRLVREAIRL